MAMNDPQDYSSTRSPWLISIALILLFGSGILVGAFGVKLMIQQKVNALVQGTPDNHATAAVELLDTHLHCSDDQKTQIQKILLDTFGDLKKIRKPVETELIERVRRGRVKLINC